MAPQGKSRAYRELVAAGGPFFPVMGCLPIHALLAQAAGADAFTISGANVSKYLLGLPDAGFVTMTEAVENAYRVARVVDIPVFADCDTGWGNAINVRRTVQAMVRAGVAGIMLEDQVSPKRCGYVKGKEVIPLEEAVGKYQAALDARDEMDSDLFIMARTDSRGAVGGSLEEAIRRAVAYEEVGVDSIMVEALQSRGEIRDVRAAVSGPLVVGTKAIEPPLTEEEKREFGLRPGAVNLNHVGAAAIYDLLAAIREQGLEFWNKFRERNRDHPMAGFREFDLVGFPKVREWEEKYLSLEQLGKYEQSLGLYDPGRR